MTAAANLRLDVYNENQAGYAFGTVVLDETPDYFAVMFRAASANTIAKAFFNISAVSGSPNLEISIQGVSSGLPDGVIKSSGNAKNAWAATATSGWRTLDSSYTPTAGEQLAVVLKLTSGTSATINCRVAGTPGYPNGIHYNNTGAVTTRLATPPVWGVKGSGTSWCQGNPISAGNSSSITTATIIESGMRFVIPSWCSSMRLVGVKIYFRLNASSSAEVRAYSGGGAADTTVAQSITVDVADLQASGTQAPFLAFLAPQTYNAGDAFRLSVRCTAGTYVELSNTVVDAEDLRAYGPWEGEAYRSRRTTGNWTDSTVNGLMLTPIFDDVTAPSGSGTTNLIQPGRRQIWTPRPVVRPVNRPTVIRQTTTTTSWVPISRTLVRAARAVRTRAPAAIVPVPGGVVTNNVYVPVAQPRRLAIRERHTRRSLSPTTLTTVTIGPTVYVSLNQSRRLAIRQQQTRRPQALAFVQTLTPVPGPTVYLPLAQPRRTAIRERWVSRRAAAPISLTTVIPGPTAYVPLRSTTKHLRPAHVVRRLPVPAVLVQQAAPQTIVISAPRIVR